MLPDLEKQVHRELEQEMKKPARVLEKTFLHLLLNLLAPLLLAEAIAIGNQTADRWRSSAACDLGLIPKCGRCATVVPSQVWVVVRWFSKDSVRSR